MTGALRMVNKSVYSDDDDELELLRQLDYIYYRKIMADRARSAGKKIKQREKKIYDNLEDALNDSE